MMGVTISSRAVEGPGRRENPRSRREAGLTLVELIVAFTILLILTTMAVPVARSSDQADSRKEIFATICAKCEPPSTNTRTWLTRARSKWRTTLTAIRRRCRSLVDGVPLLNKLSAGGEPRKIRFLRRIPNDPMTGQRQNGACAACRMTRIRISWGGQDVFDVIHKIYWIKAAMERPIRSGEPLSRREFGFTLIELMIVMAIISILLAIAVPIYQKSIMRAKESVLRNNLFTLRTMIDEYTVDKAACTRRRSTIWCRKAIFARCRSIRSPAPISRGKSIMEDTPAGGDSQPPGIFDVKSGAEGNSLDGTPYSDW